MYKSVNGIKIEMTEHEISQMQVEQRKFEVQEKYRLLSADEVNMLFIKQQINTLEVDDQIALRMLDYYPTWDSLIGQTVNKSGFKFTYQSKLYTTIPATHTFQSNWVPGVGTESIYTRIDEEHDGDIYDPIPYEGNMALIADKYYSQNGITYKCTRDTGNPVHNDLKDLVGLYVEVASE